MNPFLPAKTWDRWLLAAALYNMIWGACTVLWPTLAFRAFGMAPPNYPELWQCIGMIVGVYGIGYGIAARAPLRHWPIVLVGLLGKIFGPLGFAWALARGTFAPGFLLIIFFNDLIWWLPFARLLKRAWREHGFRV
jgi:hypothetical protein